MSTPCVIVALSQRQYWLLLTLMRDLLNVTEDSQLRREVTVLRKKLLRVGDLDAPEYISARARKERVAARIRESGEE